MKEIVAKRIRSARVMAGLSLRQLSIKMENTVSYNAIAKYEKAEMMPDRKVLLALSDALQVKPDYFFQPYSVTVQNIAFRKSQKLGAKKAIILKEEITEYLSRYLEVEQLLNIETAFNNPVKNLIIRSGEDVEHAVTILRKDWKIGVYAIPNVAETLENNEIKVIEADAPGGFDGLSGWADHTIPLIVINKHLENEQKRSTALYELGHALLHFDSTLSEKEKEKLHKRFARAFLIPRETFYAAIGRKRTCISLPELKIMRESYGILIQEIMARARDLDVISETCYLSFCRQLSKNKSEKDPGQFIGNEGSDRFKLLVYRSDSEGIISMNKAANLWDQESGEFWVGGK